MIGDKEETAKFWKAKEMEEKIEEPRELRLKVQNRWWEEDLLPFERFTSFPPFKKREKIGERIAYL